VYDVAGRLVRIVADEERPAGRTELAWDGADGNGRPVAAGVYLVRVEAGNRTARGKAVLLR